MSQPSNRSITLLRIVPVTLAAILLSACVSGPTRDDPEAFKLLREGRVPPASTQAFADCVLDKFDKAHSILSNATNRQQRRSDSYRIESLAGGRLIIVSADVFDDGRVQLLQSKKSVLVSTSGERDAFDRCLAQYGTPQR